MLTAIFETLDFAKRTAEVRSAEAFVRVRIVKPAELDDSGKLPGSDEMRYRVYARQWVKQQVVYYKEVWE